MIKQFKRIAAMGMTLCMVAAGCFAAGFPTASAEGTTQDDWLHVEGNKIYDASGNEVWLTGCNWFGYNVGSQVFDGVWSQNMHSMLQQIADHGFNFLRVPMSTELLLQWKNGDPDPATPKVNTYSNPELSVEGVEGGTVKYSFDIWNQAVQWCKEAGIKIMIDVHSAETASAGHQIHLWYTDKFSTEDWCTGLEWFADYYKDDDTILAIDLKNEPHGTADEPDIMAKWDNTTDANNWKYAAEICANRVLDVNPNLLIMIEGVEVYPMEGYDWTAPRIDYTTMTEYYHHTWWGACFRGQREYPITLKNPQYQKQVVFSPHDYGPLVWTQTWFDKDFTTQTLLDDYWYDTWAYIDDQGIAPLLIGEWGGHMDAGKNQTWMGLLRDYMIENHINHTFWCINPNSGDTGGLLDATFSKWDEEKYGLMEPSLWQDDNGRYISADHVYPLGSNGQSLTEYYGGTPTPPTTTTKPADTTASGTVTKGDLNKDGKVTIADLLLMSRYLVREIDASKIPSTAACDVNGDGRVNAVDCVLVKQFLAHLINKFPA